MDPFCFFWTCVSSDTHLNRRDRLAKNSDGKGKGEGEREIKHALLRLAIAGWLAGSLQKKWGRYRGTYVYVADTGREYSCIASSKEKYTVFKWENF